MFKRKELPLEVKDAVLMPSAYLQITPSALRDIVRFVYRRSYKEMLKKLETENPKLHSYFVDLNTTFLEGFIEAAYISHNKGRYALLYKSRENYLVHCTWFYCVLRKLDKTDYTSVLKEVLYETGVAL